MSTFGTQSDFSGAFGQQTGALSNFSGAVTGAGFADGAQAGPDLEVGWDEISKNPIYEGINLEWLPNYADANYSDAIVDLRKFSVNQGIPMDIRPGSARFEGGTDGFGASGFIDDSIQNFGNVQLNGSDIQKLVDGQWQTVDRWGENDRDALDIMGWIDPRLNLVMSDAPGWNDPLSNWLQSQGEENAADLLGKLSYRARVGDSSSAGFTPETFWPQRMSYDDAHKVFGISEGDYGNLQAWARDYFSSGAQSARHDAMFGDSFSNFLGDIMPVLGIAGLAFGLPSLLSGLGGGAAAAAGTTAAEMLGAQAAADLAMGFSLSDVALGLEGIGGLSGLGGAGLTAMGGLGALTGYGGLESLGLSELGAAGLGEGLGLSGLGAPVVDASITAVDPAGWVEGSWLEDLQAGIGAPYNTVSEDWQSAKLDPRMRLAQSGKSLYDNAGKLMADPYGDLRARMQEEAMLQTEERNAQLEAQDAALASLRKRAPKWAGVNNFIGGRI